MSNFIKRGTILVVLESSKGAIGVYNRDSPLPLNIDQVQSVRQVQSDGNVFLEGVRLTNGFSSLSMDVALLANRFIIIMTPPDKEDYVDRMEAVDAT